MENYIVPVSAGLSGIIEALTTHSLDRLKTEMQKSALIGNPTRIIETSKNIYKAGGFSNFYSGIIPRLCGIVPMRFVYWTSMQKMNEFVENKLTHIPIIFKYTVPGLVIGSVQTILNNPIEVMKIKLMTKEVNDNLNIKIFTFHGIKKVYAGFIPTIVRNCIFAICVSSIAQIYKDENKFCTGAAGGFIGSLLSQLFDMVKTELQRYRTNDSDIKTKNMFKVLHNVYKENPSKLWAKSTMRCSLGIINMGVGFYAFGVISEFLNNKIVKKIDNNTLCTT